MQKFFQTSAQVINLPGRGLRVWHDNHIRGYRHYFKPTINFMRSLLYLIAVILLIGWILGFFVYSAGGVIHILLVIAIISLLLGVIRRA
jgi:Family of unknown function (DUF5670)